MSGDATWFLQCWDTRSEPEGFILIWRLKDKTSHWFATADEAARFVESQLAEDLYLGCGYSPKDYGSKLRCKANDVYGIPSLWADIDIAGPPHTRPGLPSGEGEVLAFLDGLPLAPTAVVHSGHGIQAWWMFKEAWLFATPAERVSAAQLAKDWHDTLATHAGARGWSIDAVHDLARVMRIPGTTNNKSQPVQVRVLSLDEELRYSPDHFEPYILAGYSQAANGGGVVVSAEGLVIDPDARPPFDKHEAARVNDRGYARAWDRKRYDLKDQSGSGYDLSLANSMVRMEWTDQEITDALIANHRLHSDPPKLSAHYYAKTIGVARTSALATAVQLALPSEGPTGSSNGKVDEPSIQPAPPSAEAVKAATLDGLSKLLGVRIRRLVRYTCEPSVYRLVTDSGEYTVGGIEAITSSDKFRNVIADLCAVVIPRFKRGEWDKVAAKLLSVRDDEAVGTDSTDKGAIDTWLQKYTESHIPYAEDKREEAVRFRAPYMMGDGLAFFGDNFRTWLAAHLSVRLTPPQMGAMLRTYGARPLIVAAKIEGVATTREVWVAPGWAP